MRYQDCDVILRDVVPDYFGKCTDTGHLRIPGIHERAAESRGVVVHLVGERAAGSRAPLDETVGVEA